jgi:hypothetical protein
LPLIQTAEQRGATPVFYSQAAAVRSLLREQAEEKQTMLRPIVITLLLFVAMAAAPGCSSHHEQAARNPQPTMAAQK